jgi:exosortase/archaeosortase family protein
MRDIISFLKTLDLKYKFFSILFLFALIIKWQFNPFYLQLADLYIQILVNVSSWLSGLLGVECSVVDKVCIFSNGNELRIDTAFFSLKLIMGLLLYILIISDNKQITWVPIVFIVFGFFLNIIRTVIITLFAIKVELTTDFDHNGMYMLSLCAFIFIIFWDKLFRKSLSENTILNLCSKILFAVTLFYGLRVTFRAFFSEQDIVVDFLAEIILNVSVSILNFLEFDVFHEGRKLYNENNFVYLGTPCIGINVMLVFILVIYLSDIHINLKNVSFTLLGIIIIIVLNATRVTMLFVSVTESAFDPLVLRKQHDIYNLVIYGFVLLLWYLRFNYNSNLDYTE